MMMESDARKDQPNAWKKIYNDRRRFREKTEKFMIKKNYLYFCNKNFKVPRMREKQSLIETAHKKLHFQVKKTIDYIHSAGYRWKKMELDIKQVI
jgi:hypothetical protein